MKKCNLTQRQVIQNLNVMRVAMLQWFKNILLWNVNIYGIVIKPQKVIIVCCIQWVGK